VALLIVDELTPPGHYLDPLMVAAPALAPAFFGPRTVLLVTAVTLGSMLLAIAADLQMTNSNIYLQLIAVGLVGMIAARAAVARKRRQRALAQARWVAAVTQKVLLRPLPRRVGSLRIASVYLSADEEAAVGGDLYSVAEVDHSTRILIGDAKGKGLATIEEVGFVLSAFRRSAWHRLPLADVAAYIEDNLVEDVSAAAAMPGGADQELCLTRYPEGLVTAVVVDLPEDGDRISLVNCGHPPALLLHAGQVQPLQPAEPSLPLGLGDLGDGSRRVDTAAFGVGDTLLLYTDGLVEARDAVGGFYALAERIRAAGWFGQAPDELLESIRSDLSRHVRQHFTDDVAMVAIQRMPAAHR
jgi:serine phosphatase RsbU (regulator of sigma subunit)